MLGRRRDRDFDQKPEEVRRKGSATFFQAPTYLLLYQTTQHVQIQQGQ